MRAFFSLFLLAFTFLTEQPSGASELASFRPHKWAHDASDLPVDGRFHYGELENGLRFAWAKNETPKERCYIRLRVEVGSLYEQNDELGIAHYLEHMAFAGSKNYPEGVPLVHPLFTRVNAITDFESTTYELDLKKCDEESVRTGFTILRDFADGLKISDTKVDKERPIIDAEDNERKIEMLESRFVFEHLLSGTLYDSRWVLGTKSVRDTFTAEKISTFYRKWYCPKRMTVVAVGDFQTLDIERSLKGHFDTIAPSSVSVSEPEIGKPSFLKPHYNVPKLSGASLGTLDIFVRLLETAKKSPWNSKKLQENLKLQAVLKMLNKRLQMAIHRSEAPFLSAKVHHFGAPLLNGIEMRVSASESGWQAALVSLENELRRAVQYGFSQAEVDNAKKELRIEVEDRGQGDERINSQQLAQVLLEDASYKDFPANQKALRHLRILALEELTLEACREALVEATGGTLSISTTGRLDLGTDAVETFSAIWKAAANQKVHPIEQIEEKEFAYASGQDAGAIVFEESLAADGSTQRIFFENGVSAVLVRSDKLDENEILVLVGEIGLHPKNSPINPLLRATSFGEQILKCGLEQHEYHELVNMSEGKLDLSLNINSDFLSFQSNAKSNTMPFILDLLAAYIEHPGLKRQTLSHWKESFSNKTIAARKELNYPLIEEFEKELFAGDQRYWQSIEAMPQVTVQDIESNIQKRLKSDPIGIVMIGPDVDQAVGLLSKTFGKMNRPWSKKRFETLEDIATRYSVNQTCIARFNFSEIRKQNMLASSHCESPNFIVGKLRREYEVESDSPVSTVRMVFPLVGSEGTSEAYALLENALSQTLFEEVREKLGAVYFQPRVAFALDTANGARTLTIQFSPLSHMAHASIEATLAALDQFSSAPLSGESIDQLKENMLLQNREQRQNVNFWVNYFSAFLYPLDWMKEHPSGFETRLSEVTATKLERLAKRHILNDEVSIAIVYPK